VSAEYNASQKVGNHIVSLRKTAGLLAAFGLMVGLIGGGIGAVFTDQVTADEQISVGTFECLIVEPSDGIIAGDGKSVSYTAPTIMSSAPGSAPFSFTVAATGSIPAVLQVSTSPVSAPFSIIGAPFADQVVAYPGTYTYNTGVQWAELTSDNEGATGTVTWTIDCVEAPPESLVIFDNTPAVLPGNLASYGPEAYSYNEWGAGETFAGTARNLATATVTMSSWACESGAWTTNDCATTPGATFSVPITFKVYDVGAGNTVGSVVATKTQTFDIPYRPSADAVNCTGGDAGKWWDGATCFNGKAVNITFTFAGEDLSNTAIFGISFDTSNYGYTPLATTNNPTDSLNIATYPGTGILTAASVGSWLPDNQSTYLSTGPANGPAGAFAGPVTQMPTGPGDHFVGYMPAVKITATN
jgi:hypothetical protein